MHIAVVIPVFNDWESLRLVIKNLADDCELRRHRLTYLIVDDASKDSAPDDLATSGMPTEIFHLRLASNLGHQRAIVIGLQYVADEIHADVAVVMDGDGEDRPSDISTLLAAHEKFPGAIICARRTKRSESYVFRVFYLLYRFAFRLAVGREISFGNFMLIPTTYISQVTFHPGAWNNLAATVLRCRAPVEMVPTSRAHRYHGKSHLSLMGLTLHGLSAIAVFGDVVIGRLAFVLIASLFITGVAGMAVVMIRLTTDVLIPGFATTVILLLFSLSLQILFFSLVSILTLLSARSAPTFIVGRDGRAFIGSVRRLGEPTLQVQRTGT